MFPHLSGFRVNISLLQEAASKELFDAIDCCEGSKVNFCKHFFTKSYNQLIDSLCRRQLYGMIHYLDRLVSSLNIQALKKEM